MKNHRLLLTAGLLSLAAVTGCIQSYDEYTLNADGTGKVLHRTSVIALDMGGDSTDNPQDKAKGAIKTMVNDSEGIEAWRDVSFRVLPDGNVEIEGVAYFRELPKVRFGSEGMQEENNDLRIEVTPGRMTLQLGDTPAKAGDPVSLTTEELEAAVADSRQKFTQSQSMMAGFMGTLRVERVFRLPGTLVASEGFEQRADGSLRNLLEGTRMLAALDELMADDDYVREQVRRGENPGEGSMFSDPALTEKLFGTRRPPHAVFVNVGEAQFDYEAEVAEAAANQEAMLAALGIAAPVIAKPATGGEGFSALEVAGVQWVRTADSDDNIRPFSSTEPTYQLAVIGTLPGSVLDVTEGQVTEATDNLGNDLLPESDWERRISFPSLSESGTRIVFEVKMQSPRAAATGLRTVAGAIEYIVAGPKQDVDVGITRFAADETGSALGAAIQSLGKSDWGDEIVLALKLDLPAASIAEVTFRDAAGNLIETSQGGSMQMNDTTTIDFTTEGKWPAAGSITVSSYTDMKAYSAEFRLENIDLLGRPLADSAR